ncbi:MAG: TIGR02147 family protein [Fibrobacter sp.]|nr:TIGR02147 family protein [Fibrobacter sp.]
METTVVKSEPPNIFEYYDYRQFLKDLIAHEKQRSSVFSNRYIVQKAGFKSPTALKHVVDGKRNLSLESANKFASALKIEGIKRHYFLTLVLFNQTDSLAEREKYLNELVELKHSDDPSMIEEDQLDVLSKWYILAIREIVELPDFRNSLKWISRVLNPQITMQDAADALAVLRKNGLIEKINGRLCQVDKALETDERVRSVKVIDYHRQMIRLGAEAITRFPLEERDISGTTLRLSMQDVKNVKILLKEFRRKILSLAVNSPNADQIYQFNVQFFPLVITDRKGRLLDEREEL